ncbi:hypothetical protein, partial [Neisseria zoodegmatis]|uniref:hypothetical protein n=1 Tax=Neisseria zoodegmatis TaxID=326523 RepID=UPI00117DCAFE
MDLSRKTTRRSHRAAEEAKAVYGKCVEKFRAIPHKHCRKLDATTGTRKEQLEDDESINELPIVASAPKAALKADVAAEEEFQEVGDGVEAVESTEEQDTPIRALKAQPLP